MYWSGHICYFRQSNVLSRLCCYVEHFAVATSTMMAKLFMSSTGLGRVISDLEVGGSRGATYVGSPLDSIYSPLYNAMSSCHTMMCLRLHGNLHFFDFLALLPADAPRYSCNYGSSRQAHSLRCQPPVMYSGDLSL